MSRPRRPVTLAVAAVVAPLVAALVVALVVVSAGLVACGSSSTTGTLLPITGITVRAETLTAGHGCGTGATQVFKYVAAAFGTDPADVNSDAAVQRKDVLLAANLYDCFTDGQFVNLPGSANSFDYGVQVFVYNQAAYEAAGGDPILKGIVTRLQFNLGQIAADAAAGGAPAAIQLDLTRLLATNPTYTTSCAASQIGDVQTLAVCQPFSLGTAGVTTKPTPPGPASVDLSAASFPVADGGSVTCGNEYSRVRYRAGTGGVFGDISDTSCVNLAVHISPAVAPATYTIEAALFRPDGTALGQTTCRADTSPGVASTAVCAPLQ